MLRSVLIAGFIVFTAACASAPRTQVFSGVYAEGAESMTFTPDAREGERWAATGESDALRTLQEAGGRDYSDPFDSFAIRAEVEGRLSPRGSYGHLGMLRRELFITRVIAAEASTRARRCAPRAQRHFRGEYVLQDGVGLFRERGGDEFWWVNGDRFALRNLESLIERTGQHGASETFEAMFEGDAQFVGAYGPDGAYRCAIFVTRVLDLHGISAAP
ncbi:MAG TPA: hypothetical protein PKY87_12880 [Terricaulis sp.]|jgi:hypothetical protein|nr:hypothetical protein [Terricaulis sp.]